MTQPDGSPSGFGAQAWHEGQVTALSKSASPEERARHLEAGSIIVLDTSPFDFSAEERHFLLAQKQLQNPRHKNIAYKPHLDKVTGIKLDTSEDYEKLRTIMAGYCRSSQQFVESFLPYKNHLKVDYTSYRPIEEAGRKMRLSARNDLLHVDAFPTRPTYGGRILRVFINLNPTTPRIWHTSVPFKTLYERFKSDMPSFQSYLTRRPGMLKQLMATIGFKEAKRSPYDSWMLDFHHFMKANEDFQQHTEIYRWTIPPGSAWMVYTDTASHAVMSGQFAMEQTFIIQPSGLVAPEISPHNLLAHHCA